jgi:signal transduction histidine kinase
VRRVSADDLEGRPGWYGTPDSELRYEFECPYHRGICGFTVASEWARGLLDIEGGPELEPFADAAGEVRPAVALAGPFSGLVLRPPAEAWNEVLETHRRRIVMMASEGAFFAILLVVLVGMLWRILRREVELERRYRNFLSAITHELKSPLAAIRLSLETVSAGRADETVARRFIGNALTDTDRLERLVNKVLQATRYDSGSEVIRLREVDLTEVVGRVLVDFRPRATAAGATVASDLQGGVRAAAVDPEAFGIAVSNLLENALTYGGRPAEIRVVLRAAAARALLEVSDNGAGIDADELPFVFDRFYRVGDEMTRTAQGTGLGLYLVQRIVHAHHGTVSVAASGEDGTTFRVTLPGVEVGEVRE